MKLRDFPCPVTFRRMRTAKRISVSLNPHTGCRVTYPLLCPRRAAALFLYVNREKIAVAWEKWRLSISEREAAQEDRPVSPEQLQAVADRCRELSLLHRLPFHNVRMKRNVSNWGSCSAKKNINLNVQLAHLPENLRDYVILHELAHLRYPHHGPDFWSFLDSLCGTSARTLQRELRCYKLCRFRPPLQSDGPAITSGQSLSETIR